MRTFEQNPSPRCVLLVELDELAQQRVAAADQQQRLDVELVARVQLGELDRLERELGHGMRVISRRWGASSRTNLVLFQREAAEGLCIMLRKRRSGRSWCPNQE